MSGGNDGALCIFVGSTGHPHIRLCPGKSDLDWAEGCHQVQFPLKVGGRVVDNDAVFRVYKVEKAEGDWLWVVAGGVSGWVRSGEVVLFDKAIDYFTQLIRANPAKPTPTSSVLKSGGRKVRSISPSPTTTKPSD